MLNQYIWLLCRGSRDGPGGRDSANILSFNPFLLMTPLATPYPGGPAAYGPGQSPTLTVGDWLVTFLISVIPLVGFVMLFVWAFGSSTPPSKANWAKATLLLYAVAAVVGLLFAGSFMALIMKASQTNPRF